MLITLTTDFSDSGGFVAQMKAKIIELFSENVNIIDITHNITSFNTIEAAYIVRTTIPRFPKNSIHIVVVDPQVGSKRDIVATKCNDQYIISPDNEVLSLIEQDLTVKINKQKINPTPSKTFEGYDIMAPSAYLLYKNGIESLGEIVDKPKTPKFFPIKNKNYVKGKIVYIDKFGNCISNIEKYILSKGFKSIKIKNLTFKTLSDTYFDTSFNPKVIINSSGFLEFALYKNSFSKKFDIRYLDDVEIVL